MEQPPKQPEADTVLPGQVGWWCSRSGVGFYVLCLSCGHGRPSAADPRGGSRPLLIDEIRPHPQRCQRCKRQFVEGILPDLPDRYRIRGPSGEQP
jgi:hypothetical protein